MSIIRTLLVSSSLLLSSLAYANTPDITGLWRSVDDKTGFSRGIIEIKKENGLYSGKIVQVLPRPGYTAKETCEKCPEPYKNQPMLGLQILKNVKPHATLANEYDGGTILDPLSGKIYKSRIKINEKGNRLTMRGFIGVEVLGRSQHWIRHTP